MRQTREEFSHLGTPTDSPHIEQFNARLRNECLDSYWFLFIEDAKQKIEAWRVNYNGQRIHSWLGYRTLKKFAR